MKILCTGSSGLLGSNLELVCKDHNIEFVGFDLIKGQDVLSRDAFEITILRETPDIVVHAAAVADLYESDKNLDKNFSINVLGTYYIGRICSLNKIPLIYISTCCTYGNKGINNLIDETALCIPTETYAWSKLAGENVLGCVGPIDGCILRLGTFYGPNMRNTLFIAKVIEKILKRQTIEIHGDGEQTRRYVHVRDVSEAIVLACKNINVIGESKDNILSIINILGTVEYSVNDIIYMVSKIVNIKPYKKNIGQRQGQILKQKINYEKAKLFLGWIPKISMHKGLTECIQYYAMKNNIDLLT